MPYTLSWYTPDRVLLLTLTGQPSLQEMETINQEVTDALEAYAKLNIVIDTTDMQTGYHTANHLRDTQKYMNHQNLDSAFVVADNKLNRLITLMAFSMSRTRFMQLNTIEMVENLLKRYGFSEQSIRSTGKLN